MNNWKLACITLLSLSLLFYLHLQGMREYWYVSFPYLDIVTHFLGGVGIALSLSYILKNKKHIIVLTIIAGILWELFEVYYDITGWPISSFAYQKDTIIDIIMDTLGAIAVWLLI